MFCMAQDEAEVSWRTLITRPVLVVVWLGSQKPCRGRGNFTELEETRG
jgi:hypothetical protein